MGLHTYMKEWSTRLRLWVIDQDKYPVHILRYEDLKRDTVVEMENTQLPQCLLQSRHSQEETEGGLHRVPTTSQQRRL